MIHKKLSTAGAELSSLRRKVLSDCPICGEEFEGIKRKKYCSEKCKQRAKRLRAKQGSEKN